MTFDEVSAATVHVMDHVKLPKLVFQGCSAIILLKAKEAGFIFSGTDGGGLIFRKTEDGSVTDHQCTS